MKTLLLSAGSAASVAVAFLAGATWAASSDGRAIDQAADPLARAVTVQVGATALTLPASAGVAMPAEASAPYGAGSRLRWVLEAPAPPR